jgi:hypothetical protein
MRSIGFIKTGEKKPRLGVVECSVLDIRFSFDVGCSMFGIGYSFFIRRWVFDVRCWTFIF